MFSVGDSSRKRKRYDYCESERESGTIKSYDTPEFELFDGGYGDSCVLWADGALRCGRYRRTLTFEHGMSNRVCAVSVFAY